MESVETGKFAETEKNARKIYLLIMYFEQTRQKVTAVGLRIFMSIKLI